MAADLSDRVLAGTAVALLSETPSHLGQLRDAVASLGMVAVYESTVGAFDGGALANSQATVVVVNLDADGGEGDGLDALFDLLQDRRYRVVFNDGVVSGGLSGWDHARWLRHLAAKIAGGSAGLYPPRPPGTQAVAAPPAARAVQPEPEPEIALPTAPAADRDEALAPVQPAAVESTADVADLLHEALEAGNDEPSAALSGSGIDIDIDGLGLTDFSALPEPPEFSLPGEGEGAADAHVVFDGISVEEMDFVVAAPEAPAQSATPVTASDFGIETVRPADFLAPAVDGDAAPPVDVPATSTLELIPLEEAVAPVPIEKAGRESWLESASVARVRRVWVLGASIGGPESVRGFLSGLPRDYPALFLLAQHLGDEFTEMMAAQLAKATALTVRTPQHGDRAGHGEVVIVPSAKRLRVDAAGVVVLEEAPGDSAYSPSIDGVLRDCADDFGARAGAIVFSGMSDDAVEGCRYLAARGGTVYAQEPGTCVVSTMVDGVCEAGVVSFLGSPQELAAKLRDVVA